MQHITRMTSGPLNLYGNCSHKNYRDRVNALNTWGKCVFSLNVAHAHTSVRDVFARHRRRCCRRYTRCLQPHLVHLPSLLPLLLILLLPHPLLHLSHLPQA